MSKSMIKMILGASLLFLLPVMANAGLPGDTNNDGVVTISEVQSVINAFLGIMTTNASPLANAGPAQSVNTGALVTLNGSTSSDSNGDLLTYSWAFTSKPAGSNATLSGATAANPTFNPDVAGTYVLSLVVNDGKVNSTAATVAITASGTGTAPITWKWSNPLPQGNTLSSVTYGGGLYVNIGAAGTIVTSPDGVTWTNRNSGTPSTLYFVAYGTNMFVAVGDNGTIITSPNGITWTKRASGTTQLLESIFYGGGKFVVVGDNAILTSTDGISWSSMPAGTGKYLHAITYGNGMFVAIGGKTSFSNQSIPIIFNSTDGVSWTKQYERDNSLGYYWNQYNPSSSKISIIYGGGKFVAVVGKTILSSINGINWSVQSTGKDIYGSDYYMYGVTYGGGKFVVVGYNGHILSSTDGVTWASMTSNTELYLNSINYSIDKFVTVGEGGIILTSADGITWISQTGRTSKLDNITYVGGKIVGLGRDGVIWSRESGPEYVEQKWWAFLMSAAYGSDKFVAVSGSSDLAGGKGKIFTSDGGINWTELYNYNTKKLHAIAYSGNMFVAVGEIGTILTSVDGITWTTRSSNTTSILNSITYGGGKFVAAGNTGTIITSVDGIVWSTAPYTTFNANSVAYGNGKFVAVGNYWPSPNNILTSIDGINWTAQSSGSTFKEMDLSSIVYNESQFIAVGEKGTILTSTDGISWTGSISPTKNTLQGIGYFNGKFMIVGDYGTILTN